jgi:Asp-tRNA(Asn)/Glu-tRNA(Gln) amidotransferase A subunit family amidase
VRTRFESALDRLGSLGVRLQPLDFTHYRFAAIRRAGLLLAEAGLLDTLAVPLTHARAEIPADLLALLDFAAGKSAADLARALAIVVDAGQWVERALANVDGLLMPTAPQQAFPMDGPVPPNQADFAAMANMSGGPAISLPLSAGAGTLPVGLHLMGRRGSDRQILDSATFLEKTLCGDLSP